MSQTDNKVITSEKMTPGQKKQLMRVLEDAVDSGNFTKDQMDEILKVGNLVQADLKTSMAKHSIADKRFGAPVVEFDLTVPMNYVHETQIDTSMAKAKNEKTTYYQNDDLNSKNFSNATTKLVPGKTYSVKIFPILSQVTSTDCMTFLQKQNCILTGGQGATLAYDLAKDKLPKGKWTISFDEVKVKDSPLWKGSYGGHRVPRVGARTDGGFYFDLGDFESDWGADDVLLCFCDK
jgi:hypothetical protein